jgi:TonB family protein
MKKLLLPALGLLLPMLGLAQECRPEVIAQPRPEYPPIMLRLQDEGTVHFDFRIRPDGTVDDVRVLKSPNPHFAQATVAAVQRWRFKPLNCAPPGEAASQGVRIRSYIRFQLEEEGS